MPCTVISIGMQNGTLTCKAYNPILSLFHLSFFSCVVHFSFALGSILNVWYLVVVVFFFFTLLICLVVAIRKLCSYLLFNLIGKHGNFSTSFFRKKKTYIKRWIISKTSCFGSCFFLILETKLGH